MAQFDNELSLNEGDMVYLKRYVDCEWLEGEIDGKIALFPEWAWRQLTFIIKLNFL